VTDELRASGQEAMYVNRPMFYMRSAKATESFITDAGVTMFTAMSRPQYKMVVEAHTFMFADISGYSLLAELNGDEAAADIALDFAERASMLSARHGAEVIKSLGDAVMVHARDAAAAVSLALDLVAECDRDPSLPPIHVGLHTGPAFKRANDWWGATVNVAARVAAAATAGQILLTDRTRQSAGEMHATELRGLGPLHLKNIPSPVDVFAARRVDRPMPGGDPTYCARGHHRLALAM
jgi:adenylate cyclase